MSAGGSVPEVSSYRRAMVLSTASSMLVPVIGLATAPILTHSLGVVGRGLEGAAVAPNLLIVGGVTLGLPQAATYVLAKNPHLTRAVIAWAGILSLAAGGLSIIGVLALRSYLSAGDASLADLMLIGTWFALPGLLVGVLRGAAIGRHMWRAAAAERIINSVLRLTLLGVLAALGRLDVMTAVLVMAVGPLVASLAYVGLARPSGGALGSEPVQNPSDRDVEGLPRKLISFGARAWLGSIATVLLARLGSLLITPLSDVGELGLFLVAVTIADVPYILSQTVRDVTFGSNSADNNMGRLLATSRIATLVTVAGALVIGVSLPFWISTVFGPGFRAAVVPTWLLLSASCFAVPGLIASAGIDAAGRPGRRSVGLFLSALMNVVGLVTLVPVWGAIGAGLAGFLAAFVSTGFMIFSARRLLGGATRDFFVPRRADLVLLRGAATGVLHRLTR